MQGAQVYGKVDPVGTRQLNLTDPEVARGMSDGKAKPCMRDAVCAALTGMRVKLSYVPA